MKTLSDKAVTNQSHWESRRTVKDISGQSSHAVVRRGRPVTAHSHAAPLPLRSHRKALCSCFSLSLSFLSSARHAPSCLRRPDRGTQAALIGVDRWLCATEVSGVTAEPAWPVVVTKANARPKHTHASTPNRITPANMPKCPSTLALGNACPILYFSFCLYILLFSSSFAAHLSF